MTEFEWSEWKLLTEANEKPTRMLIEKSSKHGIVYEIGVLCNNAPISLPEGAEPVDPAGIVYIGMQTYSHRLKDHLRALTHGGEYEKKSTAARNWNRYFSGKYGKNFRFRYAKTEDARASELLLLRAYKQDYRRLPLLNATI